MDRSLLRRTASTAVLCWLLLSSAHGAPTQAFINGLPKAELHLHFEGSLEPEEYLALAARNGLPRRYADADAVRQRLRHATDLNTFIEVYEEMLSAMHTREDFRDVALACFGRLHGEGVVHVEMFFDPQMHTTRGIAIETVLGGLEDARTEAVARYPISIGYILCFNRNRSAQSAMDTLESVGPRRGHIVGIGLDNNEEHGFPAKFQAVFERAAAMGLHRTSHCDVNQPYSVEHLRGCLHLLGVERLDHATNVLDDPALVAEVGQRGIGLTVCPTLLYSDIPGRLEARSKAIKRMLDLGLRVTVNSDDPGLMRSLYVSDLMGKVAQTAALSRGEVVTLARNSFVVSWIPEAERRADLAALDAYVASHPDGG